MRSIINSLLIMMILNLFNFGASSQEDKTIKDRQPYAAGRFFTSDPVKLKAELKQLFKMAVPRKYEHVRAVIAPHAGYVYSGEVAACSFNQIDPDAEYENIFIIASSHRVTFGGASIYQQGNYQTPLGEVTVNRELAARLIAANEVFIFREDAHTHEHSLEVQVPFLQFHMNKKIRIVPIIMGTQNISDCEKVAEALKPYFNDNNLFVISTDFSHYPSYQQATEVDRNTADAILKNEVNALQNALAENKQKGYSDLATSLCGWSSVYTLLYLTADDPDLEYHKLKYMNSGDQPFGDKSSVVGYYALAVSKKKSSSAEKPPFSLSRKERDILLGIARHTINAYIKEGVKPELDTSGYSERLLSKCGTFVTLHKDGALRGCIGRFTSNEPLYRAVSDMAIASSTQDHRFPPVTAQEIDDLEIEISVLTPLRKISSFDEIELGRHGIYISKGYRSGTFLPQVATETNWTLEEFLGHCARDKAGIGWNGWKSADIYIYEALVFGEKE